MKKRNKGKTWVETSEGKDIKVWRGFIIITISVFLFLRFFVDGMSYPEFNFFWNILFFTLAIGQLLRDLKSTYSKEEILLLLFFLFSVISTGTSPIKGTGMVFNAQILAYWCILLLISRNFRLKDTKIVFYIILICGLFITLYGIYQHFWGLEQTRQLVYSQPELLKSLPPTFLQRMESNRVFATFVYPNIFASFLLFLLPLSFFPIISRNSLPVRILCFTVFSLSFYNLLLTGSLGGIFIFLFVAQIMLLFLLIDNLPESSTTTASTQNARFMTIEKTRDQTMVKLKRFRCILFFLILFEVFLVSAGYFAGKLPKMTSFEDRISYWKSSICILFENPIMGIGTENYRFHYTRFKQPGGMEAKHPHSILFATLSENGLTGTFFLLSFLIIVSKALFKAAGSSLFFTGIAFSFLAFFLHNFIDFNFINPSVAILFFVSAGLTGVIKKDKVSLPLTRWLSYLIIIVVCFTATGYTRYFFSEKNLLKTQGVKDIGGVIYYLERAERLYPDNFDIYNKKGDIFYKLFTETKEPVYKESAENYYLYALSLNPRLSAVYRKLAFLYEYSGKNKSAERMYLNLLDNYPNKKQYNIETAVFYKKTGDEKKFLHYYEIGEKLPAVDAEESNIVQYYEKWIKSQK